MNRTSSELGKRGENMTEVVRFLKENPVQYLATVGINGKAKCRPFKFCLEQEGKLWFCTSNTKEVYKDMQANPGVELAVLSKEDEVCLRVRGIATFEENREIKQACMGDYLIKELFQSADDPTFEVFYLADAKATITDMFGNEVHTYDCFV